MGSKRYIGSKQLSIQAVRSKKRSRKKEIYRYSNQRSRREVRIGRLSSVVVGERDGKQQKYIAKNLTT